MPVLSNARHERFAQAVARGASAIEAYAEAGYREDRGNASRLTANDSIRARVEDLKMAGATRAEVTVETLLAEAEEARRKAMEAGQFSAAIAAIREKGVLSGLRVEKREQQVRSADQLSDAELEAIVRGGGPTQH